MNRLLLCTLFFLMVDRSALAADVTFTIDPSAASRPISRYIYGANAGGGLNDPGYADLNLTLARLGGNRWTAYNWTNNASNAGNDWHYSNDVFLDASQKPGHAVKEALTEDARRDAATIITVPMNGYLSADENGPVPKEVLPQNSPHFVPEYPTAAADPHPSPLHIYQDQFIRWIKTNFSASLAADSAHPIFFMLDNEPDLWASTHAEVHPEKPTYAEMVQLSAAYATAIKTVAPDSPVFGPASYGWNGFVTLQDANDAKANNATYGDFLSYYLAKMKAEETRLHRRLLDALDVHWYPEIMAADAEGKPAHITGTDASPGVALARMNGPRSLWDPTFVETSWITKYSTSGKPITLLPRLNDEIKKNYPGTKLSMSEYNYGGGEDISGGVAEADVLGLLGKYGVYAACEWPMESKQKFVFGGMRMYRNYDGHGAAFGDTSIHAQSSNPADESIYASVDSHRPGQMVLIAINRTMADKTAAIVLQNSGKTFSAFTVYQLTSSSATSNDGLNVLPTKVGTFPVEKLSDYAMPAASVSTIVLSKN